jgi:uncharacterized protein (TIGR02996 family)
MSGQIESFLHAIRESPEDDVPRLVLADWFEDNGDPDRAEFVRTQIRLAGDLPAGERTALEDREKELRDANAARWLGPLASKPWSATFVRGTACVRVQTGRPLASAKVQKQAEEWFTPALVTEMVADGTTSTWKRFVALPLLEGLTGLILSGCKMSEADVQALAASPRLANLRHLAIRDSGSLYRGLGEVGMTALIESPHLRRLTGLDFRIFPLGSQAVELLATRSPWPRLTSLNLDNTKLSGNTLRLLLEAPWKARLTELSLFHSLRDGTDVENLVRDLAPARLRYLCLGTNHVSDAGAEIIAASPHFGELRELRLDFPKFTESGARALADSPHLRKLRLLYVYDMKAGSPAGRVLRERFGDVVQFEWSARA